MKKISLIFTFVVLCLALFAMSAFAASFTRGPEGDTITAEDIESIELTDGSKSAKGEPKNALDGMYNTYWAGATGNSIRITLINEWEITNAKAMLAGNWCFMEISFYDANNNKIGSASNNIQTNYDYLYGGDATNGTYTDYTSAVKNASYADSDNGVKYIIVKNTGDKWGYLPNVFELVFTGRERIPSVGCENHQFEAVYTKEPTCTEAGTMVNKCTLCGAEEAPVVVAALGHNLGEYRIKTPATCISAPVIEFECTRCGTTMERDANVEDVTDYGDIYTIEGVAGGGTSFGSILDNNMDSYAMASGGWYVEEKMNLDMAYYISGVTVWVGNARYDSISTHSAWLILFYQAPGSDEWVEAGRIETPAKLMSEKYEYILELETPVYADAVKVFVGSPTGAYDGQGPGLESFNGCVYEAKVAGSIVPDTAAGHTWVAGNTVAADCDDFGYTTYACSVCGATKTADKTDPLGHTWVDATCTEPKTCSVCSVTTGEAKGHKYVAGEQQADGSVTWTCSVCGDYYVINNSAINGNYFLGTDAVVFADGVLTALGNEYTYTYNVTTGMVTTNDDTIYFQVIDGVVYFKGAEPLHQHTMENCVKEAQEDGTINCVCQYCGNVVFVINNAAINGEYYLGTDKVVFANGVLNAMGGEFTYEYNVTTGMVDTSAAGIFFQVIDGKIYFRGAEVLHQHVEENYVAETQEDGSVNYICTFCGEVVYVINNAALNGEYFADAMTSFVFADGVVTMNGESYNYTYNVTTGVLTVENAPEGILSVVDGEIFFRKTVKLHQHNADEFITEVTDPTCTTDGYTTYICQYCGPLYTDDVVPAGHAWVEADYQPATCTTAGYQNYTCENCDATKSEEFAIDENAHQPNYSIEMDSAEATCQADGYWKYTCLYCAQEITEVYEKNADAHQFDWDKYVYVAPTCQTAGYEINVCLLCEAEVRYDYQASEYAHVETEVAIEGGYQYTCDLCGATRIEITKGTAMDPIIAVTGENNFVYYATEEDFVVYGYTVSDAGTITVTFGSEVKAFVGSNLMGWYYEASVGTTFTFEAPSAGEYMIVISKDATVETFDVSFTEKVYPALTLGDNTVEIDSIGGSVEYVVNVAGDYVLTLGENASAAIIYGPYYSETVESGYEFTVAEGEKIKFAIGTADFQIGSVVVTLASAHVHTEEIIPAVPGELRNPGMTSGVKCSECGEVLVAPVTADANFRFAAVNLSLGESVAISYKVQIPAGFENAYVVFDFAGEQTVVSEYTIEKSSGRYVFMFTGVRLQSMADLVTATVYAEKDGVVHANSYSNYSVKTYIVNQLNKSTDSKLKTMLSDLLILGAKTQVYMNYNKDNLMTADVNNLTPSTYAGVPADEFVQKMIVNDESTRNIADWKAVSLTFTDAMALQFKLAIDESELENIEIRITLPGTNVADEIVTFTAEDLTYVESEDRYVLLVENIKALQYGKTVVGEIYHNGVQISRTVNYSVNSYIQKNQDSSNVALRDFLRAAYVYGEAVCAYNGK